MNRRPPRVAAGVASGRTERMRSAFVRAVEIEGLLPITRGNLVLRALPDGSAVLPDGDESRTGDTRLRWRRLELRQPNSPVVAEKTVRVLPPRSTRS